MGFKYQVGESVEYKPAGAKPALFTVIRLMPEELQAVDRRYFIKSVVNGSERNVMECDLGRPAVAEHEYDTSLVVRRFAGRG